MASSCLAMASQLHFSPHLSATASISSSSSSSSSSSPPPPYSVKTRRRWRFKMSPRSVSEESLFFMNSSGISDEENGTVGHGKALHRRDVLKPFLGILAGSVCLPKDHFAVASEFADMPAIRGKDYGKSKMRYPDYVETESGLQYKDLRVGDGRLPKLGEIVVVDWDGYTIGYYGRIFEARNKTKGGSFEGEDKDFFKFQVGSHQVIPAFEEAIVGMSPGGIRRIVVPPELGYPENDYNKAGPRPTTFSGQRALDFVLRNQGLIDKTLLFDIELLKILAN